MSVHLPSSLAVSSSKGCCFTPFRSQVNKGEIKIPATLKEGELSPFEMEELNRRIKPAMVQEVGRFASICRCFSKVFPGYRRAQSERASMIFASYLEEKYGRKVVDRVLDSVNWSVIKENLLLKDVIEIKKIAEKFFLQIKCREYASGGMICEGDVCWVVQDGHWNPKIKVDKVDPSAQDRHIIEDFSEDIVREKLQRNTEASEEQVLAVIAGMRERVYQSRDCKLVVSSRKIDEFLIKEIAEKQVEVECMEKFNLERAQSFLQIETTPPPHEEEKGGSVNSSQSNSKSSSEIESSLYCNMMFWL